MVKRIVKPIEFSFDCIKNTRAQPIKRFDFRHAKILVKQFLIGQDSGGLTGDKSIIEQKRPDFNICEPKPPDCKSIMVTLNFEKLGGLVPVVVQDHQTGEVLMLAFMNEEAWKATLETGRATYYSRSRKSLWVKGETSGNVQRVLEILIDCDNDAIVLKIEQVGGAACHTGYRSCFHKKVVHGAVRIIGEPVFDPKEVY
jgi:phosphoribosyl-AMP cyclohydrolase